MNQQDLARSGAKQRWQDESGVTLVYALLVALVVGAVVAVTFAFAFGEQRQAAFELDFEDTIHTAEAGVETALQELADDSDWTAVDTGGTAVSGPSVLQDRYDWAIAEATAQTGGVYDLPAIDTGEGETVAIRPADTDTEWVYGVGFTPTRDAFVNGTGESFARVVRTQVSFSPTTFNGEFAVLVGGNINITSNAYKISGNNGSLHSNGAINISKDNVDETISFSGSCTGSQCPDNNASVQGPVDPITIPSIFAIDVWETAEAQSIAGVGDWYDYCDGTGAYTGASGTGWYQRDAADTQPCQGTSVGSPFGISGTSLNNVSNPGAVFYFDTTAAVDVKKVSGEATIIALGDIDQGPSASSPALEPRYPGLLFVTEGNLDIGGNAETTGATPGLAYARGNLTLRGTANSTGIAYVARDAANIESQYLGGGNGEVNYNGGASTNLGGDGDPIVLRWEELQD